MSRSSRAAAVLVLLAAATAHAQEGPPPDFEPPEIIDRPVAAWPEGAPASETDVIVGLEILVDDAGRTAAVKLVRPAGEPFDSAAVEAARAFTWKPARARGRNVKTRVEYDFSFTPPPPPAPVSATIRGVVLERGTRKPVITADLAALDASGNAAGDGRTDERGQFVIGDLPAGKYKVIVVSPEHRRREFEEEVAAGEVVEVRYLLEPNDSDPYTTVVEGEGARTELQRTSATRDEATRIAGSRGDALRVIENFPGVARPVFGAGFLVVRGSNPEDTTAYLGGHWVPLIYHFGGITSIINSDLLEKIDFLPGNFSARYGRAMGGVVDVDLRAPRKDRLTGYVDVSLLDAGFLLEGPVGRGSWAVAARRSYVDAVLEAVIPDDAGFSFFAAPRYWDYQALFDHPLAGGRFSLTAFGSRDEFGLVLDDPATIDPGVRGALSNVTYIQRISATYRKDLDARTRFVASVAQGFSSFGFSIGDFFLLELDAWFASWRFEVAHRPFDRVRVTVGTEGQIYPFHVVTSTPGRPPEEGEVPRPPSTGERLEQDRHDYEARLGLLYMEAEFDLGGGFTLTPGSRIDYYRLNDTFAADPRLSARWSDGTQTVRAGVGQYSQPPLEFESDPVYGNPRLLAQRSLHASIGYDRQLTRTLRLETTLFYKDLHDLVVRDDSLIMKDDGSIGIAGYGNVGDGRVHGAEFQARWKASKDVFGWLSYTYSRSERRNPGDEDLRPFMFDQPHILTAVISVMLPGKILVGGRFRLVSGNPATPIIGSVYDADADVYAPIPGDINSERLDAFHQLDLRVERKFRFDSWAMTAYLDVQNVYNQANAEGFTYSYDYRERQKITGLPLFPSFGVKGEF